MFSLVLWECQDMNTGQGIIEAPITMICLCKLASVFESMDEAGHHKYKVFKATRPEHAVLSRGA